MDEASDSVFGKVWATNFAPILAPGSSPEADQMWKEVARMNHAKERLEALGYPEGSRRFGLAHLEFVTEEVPLSKTQEELRELLILCDDEALSADYAPFIEAPLESDEDQAAARACLCRIIGTSGTGGYKKNHREVLDAMQNVVAVAQACWIAKARKKLVIFLTKLTSCPVYDEKEFAKTRAVLREMAASDEIVLTSLNKYYFELDREV